MVSASFLLSLAFGLLPLVKSSEIIPFDYSYPYGAPAGCCNGYYDDPNLDILNNGDMPTWIGITNCIQWDAEENDFKPLLDLGTSFNVEKIEVSYIINVGMGKTDVESISCSASFDEPEVGNTQWDYEATEVATTENLVAGGYIFTLTTNNWNNVRYIELTEVVPWQIRSVVSEVTVHGLPFVAPSSKPSLVPSSSPSTVQSSTEDEECCSTDGENCDLDGRFCGRILCSILCGGTWLSTSGTF